MVELIATGVLQIRETATSVAVDWPDASIIVEITIIKSVHSLSSAIADMAIDSRWTQRAVRREDAKH